jgi:hypothetical protein
VTVSNSSSGPYAGNLSVASITKTGANAGDFVISSDGCTGTSTPPGSACTVQVAFKPLQPTTCGANSARSASLSITDNAPGSPHTVPLSGTAMSFCIATSPSQPVQAPITPGSTATFSLEVDSYGGFTGSAGLSCAVQVSPANSQEPNYVSGCSITTTPATNPAVVQVSANNPGEFQAVVTTTTAPASTTTDAGWWARPSDGGWFGLFIAGLVLLLAAGFGRGRLLRLRLIHVAAVLAAAALLASCGGGSGAAPDPALPVGNFTYTVTVTATFSAAGQPNVQTQFSFPLTVQQTN